MMSTTHDFIRSFTDERKTKWKIDKKYYSFRDLLHRFVCGWTQKLKVLHEKWSFDFLFSTVATTWNSYFACVQHACSIYSQNSWFLFFFWLFTILVRPNSVTTRKLICKCKHEFRCRFPFFRCWFGFVNAFCFLSNSKINSRHWNKPEWVYPAGKPPTLRCLMNAYPNRVW